MNWNDISSTMVIIFLIMDPFGNAPVFNSLLSQLDSRRRALVVGRELIIALCILLGFLFAGNVIMKFLGLTQSSLSISGGILLFIISIQMIFSSVKMTSDTLENEIPFIVPIAVPMVAGPSTIAILLLLSSGQPDKIAEWSTALFLAWVAATALLVASPFVLKYIGSRGSRALERLMGLILVILATQMLLNGIRDFIGSL